MAIKTYWPKKNLGSRAASRDFGRRRFGNPLFHPPASKGVSWHQRQRNQRTWSIPWRGLLALVVVAGLGYGLWYLLWSEAFRVKTTETYVEGASPEVELIIRGLLDERLMSRTLLVFPQDNLLLLSVSGLKDDIAGRVNLAKLDVNKKLPQSLTVTVKENEPKVVATSGEKLFVADAEGRVIRELTEGERIKLGELPSSLKALTERGSDVMVVSTNELFADQAATVAGGTGTAAATAMPSIEPATRLAWPLVIREDDAPKGLPKKSYDVGDVVLPPEAIATVLEVEAKMESACGTKVKWYTSRPSGETVEAMTAEGWTAQLSTAAPVAQQLTYLQFMLNKSIGKRRADLIFIDVRYGEKIFAKFKEKPTAETSGKKTPAN